MNPTHTPPLPRRGLRRILSLVLATTGIALIAPLAQAQTATVIINASSVVRDVPAGLGGVCMASNFWETNSPNYRDELMRAKVGAVRIVGYPADTTDPTKLGSVEALDRKVAQIINAGAVPVFIQCIESESQTVFKNALLRLDGTLYPTGDTTPIRQRVATNLTFLAKRYRAAPFNLTTQYWEIGNEPDLANVNYRVANPAEYIGFFDAAHDQLDTSEVREDVLLAGPSMSWDYGYDTWRDTLMHDFLTACASQVDIVTRHQYAGIRTWESIPFTPYTLLNNPKQTLHFDHTFLGYSNRGEARLLAAMDARDVPTTVGTGITEMDLWWNDQGAHWFNTITQSLWHVLSHRNALYNTRSLLTNGFLFDRYSGDHAFFNGDRTPGYSYWGTYIIGALTGDQMLAQTSNNSHLVVAGSKDARHIYVLLLNRHDATTFSANVTVSNATVVGTPVEFTLSATENTLAAGVPATGLGTSFTRTVAPMSIKVIRFDRADAATPPAPPTPPTTTHFTTSFDSAPASMQTYAVGFTPTLASGRLQLTSTTSHMRAAVILNGQPLPAARNRAQIRFGFQVVHNNAEGFVFGAYSASPGAVGDAGQALGYHGQTNRLWGVKIDNSPDQIAIIPATTNATVDGWATQPIELYNGSDKFMVIDYDGSAGTLRARMYQGTNDTGALLSDVTSRVGVPASLPTGTVFGFTGATAHYSQTTYINDLTVLADNAGGGGFTLGEEVVLDNASPSGVTITGTWSPATYPATYYATDYLHDQNNSKGSKSVRYTPNLTGSGSRDVYMRWPAHANWSDVAPVVIQHAGGTFSRTVDQKTNGGQWIKLGTWQFDSGSTGYVQINTGETTQHVVADAVRFVNVATP
ncbi:MAG: FAD-dependent oxidoreductase [Rariglobus sp.]|jgi:hypothetical protein|nr:FAD-dependent oxidoreductase [Rariglobus sp.]